MTKPPPRHLQIAAKDGATPLDPAQKRFNSLSSQLEKTRLLLASWHDNIPLFMTVYRERVPPLGEALEAAQTNWVRELDRLLADKGLTRSEKDFLRITLFDVLPALMDSDDEALQAEMLALHDRHADMPRAEQWAMQRESVLAVFEEATGLMPGDEALDMDEDELMAHLQSRLAQEAASRDADASSGRHGAPPNGLPFGMDGDETHPPGHHKPRKTSKAKAKAQAEAELTAQSLRDIYRKLASALHPDRETDPAKKDARTAMMQRANQAYDKKDLLALLGLQIECAQLDGKGLAGTAPERLKLYNKALAEQLEDLKAQLVHVEMSFCMDFNVPPDMKVHPDKLVKVLDYICRDMTMAQHDLERDLRAFQDKAATKRWIKREREIAKMYDAMDPWFD